MLFSDLIRHLTLDILGEESYTPQVIELHGLDLVKFYCGPLLEVFGRLSGKEYPLSEDSLRVQELLIPSPVTLEHKFLFATDLHLGTPGQMDEKGIDLVFDEICGRLASASGHRGLLIGGDFVNKPLMPVDNATSFRVFPQFLSRINHLLNTEINIIAIPGNHDLENPDWESYYRPALEHSGVVFLDNFETFNIGEITVVGMPEFTQPHVRSHFDQMAEEARLFLASHLTQSNPTIFLSHNPDAVDHIIGLLGRQDIVLTGHSHRSGYDMNRGVLANLLGRLALKAAPIQDHVSSKQGYRTLPKGATLYNPSGLGNHPLHGARRIWHEMIDLTFQPM